jgi:hypothetical protein
VLGYLARLEIFVNAVTEQMQREDYKTVVEYFDMKSESNIKSMLAKAM